jgi:hypothetical protein
MLTRALAKREYVSWDRVHIVIDTAGHRGGTLEQGNRGASQSFPEHGKEIDT